MSLVIPPFSSWFSVILILLFTIFSHSCFDRNMDFCKWIGCIFPEFLCREWILDVWNSWICVCNDKVFAKNICLLWVNSGRLHNFGRNVNFFPSILHKIRYSHLLSNHTSCYIWAGGSFASPWNCLDTMCWNLYSFAMSLFVSSFRSRIVRRVEISSCELDYIKMIAMLSCINCDCVLPAVEPWLRTMKVRLPVYRTLWHTKHKLQENIFIIKHFFCIVTKWSFKGLECRLLQNMI